ncbi:MAG: segregation/condensation protein A, partial [Anaerolineae bacterium]
VVAPLAVTIADTIQYIDGLLTRTGTLYFHELLREAGSRSLVIVTFLALLELLKAGRVQVQQERLFGDIVVVRAEPPQPVATTS